MRSDGMAARDARRWNEEAARLEAYVTAGNSPDVPPIRAWARATADQVHPERLGRLANEYLDETGSPGPAMSATTTKSEGAAVTGNVFRGTTWFPPRPQLPAPFDTWEVLNASS